MTEVDRKSQIASARRCFEGVAYSMGTRRRLAGYSCDAVAGPAYHVKSGQLWRARDTTSETKW